ncbi:MAG: carotenoid oxygenase family protein [Chlamydiia bacterium]
MSIRWSLMMAALLVACNSPTPPPRSPDQKFWDAHLFFDLDKEVDRYACPAEGKIPSWLRGTLLRNGPAKFKVGERRVDWFDGLAMIHGFEFVPEGVFYTNRFLRSEQYYLMVNEKSLDFEGFSMDPHHALLKSLLPSSVPEAMKNIHNADVSLQEYANRLVALTEIPLPVVFDGRSLNTLGNFHYADALQQGQWESAHPQRDPKTNETVNYFVRFGERSSYVIWKMADHASSRQVIAEIPVERPAYMHSFALTENYAVLVEFPFVVHPLDLVLHKKPFIFNYQWAPELGTTFLVVDRRTGEVRRLKGEPFFAFHHVNAFEADHEIVIDTITYANADIIRAVSGQITEASKVRSAEQTRLERFTLDLEAKKLSRELLFDVPSELPRVAAARTAQKYQYGYAPDIRFPTSTRDVRPLYKFDVTSKTNLKWEEAGCFPGEAIFVPHPQGTSEDSGVVLSLVLDMRNRSSFLLMLDATDFKELARVRTPFAIPVGLHGMWKEISSK